VQRLLQITLLLFFHVGLYAQHPYYYAVNDYKGLPSNEVFYMLQDTKGFVWLGTNAGLFRFDGTEFIAFKNQSQNSKAISHLLFDRQGKLWCQNFSGQLFYVDGDSLKTAFDFSKSKSNFPMFVFDDSNSIFITSDNGILSFTGQQQQTLSLNRTETLSVKDEFADLLWHDDRLFYAEKKSVGYFKNGHLHKITASNHPRQFQDVFLSSSLHKVDRRVLLLARGEKQSSLWEIRNDSLMWHRDLPHQLGRVFSLHDDKHGRIWIGSSNGALCLDYALQEQYSGRLFFPGKSISDVILDAEGNYWFSTLQDGIFIVPNTEVWIHTDENSPLADARIRQLTKDDKSNLFVGYQNGKLSKYNLKDKSIATISFPNSAVEIQSLFYDAELDEVLVAQGKTWTVNAASLHPTFINGISNVKAITKISDGEFLFGTVLLAVQLKLKPVLKFSERLRYKRTRAVFYEQAEKRAWICYVDGVWTRQNGVGGELRFNGNPIQATDITQTANGLVWLSTVSNGVLGFREGKFERQINSDAGIVNGFVRKVTANGNTLWIVAEHSLIALDVVSGKQKTYNRFDGLPSLEIADIEFVGDKILLATPKGLVEIPEDFSSFNAVPPSIYISSFAIKEKDTTLLNAYTLPYEQNNIRINFRGIAFRSQGQFTYRYRMLGLDSAWVQTNSSSNFARYPSLPAGNYTFEVKALNEDGVQSVAAATLKIKILRPFWQRWWFYLLVMFVAIALVTAFFLWRIRSLRKKADLEKRAIHSQLTALKSQMNPHFMFNALNSIQDLVLQQDTTNAQLYLCKFSDLTRSVLDASGAEFIPLRNEVEMLTLYLDLEQLRFGDNLQYALNVDAQLDLDIVKIPSLIVQPFVENALKHGLMHQHGKKQLTVAFYPSGNALVCEVDDNGIGRKASEEINKRNKKHHSFATEAIAARFDLLNDLFKLKIDLKIIDKQQGTRVMIIIPNQITHGKH